MRVFLAGGGTPEESKLLDELFAQQIDQSKPLFYIPNAIKDERYPGCLEWFKSMIGDVGITNFEMISELEKYAKEIPACSSMYIGGGNTTKLLSEIRSSVFEKYIEKALSTNIPVYGGSAGAIILGETILTAPESTGLDRETARGLNILNGFSVVCHYNGKDDLRELCRELDIKVIAIPEKSGVYIENGNVKVIGYESISVFDKERKVVMNPLENNMFDVLLDVKL